MLSIEICSSIKACALQWWNIGAPSAELDDMKAAKYTGTYADLNIYITMMQDNLLGCARPSYLPCPPSQLLLLETRRSGHPLAL